jgi:hypothetical protein
MSSNKLFTYGYDMKMAPNGPAGINKNMKYKATFELLAPGKFAENPTEVLVEHDADLSDKVIKDALKKKYTKNTKIKFVDQLYSPDLFKKSRGKSKKKSSVKPKMAVTEKSKEELVNIEPKPKKKSVPKESMSLSGKKVAELKAMAKEKKIKGYYKMKKAELLSALGGSAPAPKEVKAPKKKIIKIKKAVPKEEPKKEAAKKKPIMTKARLRELRKTKPKYPPPAPPTKPAKKKIVKKAKAPAKKGKGPIVIDSANLGKAQKGEGFAILPKRKPPKRRPKGSILKGEKAPEFKDADFSKQNMFLRTGRKSYLK